MSKRQERRLRETPDPNPSILEKQPGLVSGVFKAQHGIDSDGCEEHQGLGFGAFEGPDSGVLHSEWPDYCPDSDFDDWRYLDEEGDLEGEPRECGLPEVFGGFPEVVEPGAGRISEGQPGSVR